ncbi:MAG: four helix bundle protein [Candidatus Levybacteria bacterium]|nr:four helix bundle protein [Candidatus Levybacteria bacterium]
MQNDRLKFKNEFKKRIYKFVLRGIKFIGILDLKDPVCRVIADQLTRSITSILSNYIEGQASSSRKEFTLYFDRSLKSSNESKVWLALLRDSEKCNKKEAELLLAELSEIANIFASSLLTLKGKR